MLRVSLFWWYDVNQNSTSTLYIIIVQCSVSCGRGVKVRSFICWNDVAQEPVASKHCGNISRPILKESCLHRSECPIWTTSVWSAVSINKLTFPVLFVYQSQHLCNLNIFCMYTLTLTSFPHRYFVLFSTHLLCDRSSVLPGVVNNTVEGIYCVLIH